MELSYHDWRIKTFRQTPVANRLTVDIVAHNVAMFGAGPCDLRPRMACKSATEIEQLRIKRLHRFARPAEIFIDHDAREPVEVVFRRIARQRDGTQKVRTVRIRMAPFRAERGEGTVGKFLSTNDAVYADIAATAGASGAGLRTHINSWRGNRKHPAVIKARNAADTMDSFISINLFSVQIFDIGYDHTAVIFV